MMFSTTADLTSSVYLLEFMTKASKIMYFDKLVSRSLRAKEYCSVFRDLDQPEQGGQSEQGKSGRGQVEEEKEV